MEKFYQQMREENRGNRIWLIIWVVAVSTVVLKIFDDKLLDTVVVDVLIIISSYEYFTKYFFLYKEGNYIVRRFKFLFFIGKNDYTHLADRLRYHSFSSKEYIKLLVIKFVPVQLVTFIIISLYELVYSFGSPDAFFAHNLFKMFSFVIIPFLVAIVFWYVKAAELTSLDRTADRIKYMIIDNGISLLKYIFVIFVFCRFVVIGWNVVLGRIFFSDMANPTWSFATYYTNEFLKFIVILVAVLSYLSVCRYRTAFARKMIGLICLGMIFSTFFFTVKKNVIVNDGIIRINEKFKATEYAFSDIKYCTITKRDKDNVPKIYNLYLNDGKKVKINFDNIISSYNIEEDGQLTDETDDIRVKRLFEKALREYKIEIR